MATPSTSSHIPYKSTAVALLFALFLGPLGLLYASFWGGFLLIVLDTIVLSNLMVDHKYAVPFLLVQIVSCVWAVGAVEKFNRQNFQSSQK